MKRVRILSYNPIFMKKNTITLLTAATLLLFTVSCKKDKKEDTPEKSKTELLITTTWKFDKAETASGTNLAAGIPDCWEDNTADFDASANTEITGTGTIGEGANVCATSSAGPFTWSFQSNETVLFMSTPVIPTGSGTFNIVTLNETNMVLLQNMTLPVFGNTDVYFTFKH
jgi:hypothetical protein